MDAWDYKILREVQRNADITVNELAAKVNLSPTPCWRRLRRLEHDGVIRGRVALVDGAQVGLQLCAFVTVRGPTHSAAWAARFLAVVTAYPEVLEVHRIAGDRDYLLKVVVRDIAAYDAFYRRLITDIEAARVSSAISLQQAKYTTALPL